MEVVNEIAVLVEFSVLKVFSWPYPCSDASVVAAVAELQPDVVVLDLSLGETTGFEVARRLKSGGSSARIVFLTIHEGAEFVRAAELLGVSGYVYKSQAAYELPKALTAAFQGQTFFPQDDDNLASNHS